MANTSHAAARPGLVATVVAALITGGLAGAGVAIGWYPPVVGVLAAAVIGVAVGMKIKALRGGPQ